MTPALENFGFCHYNILNNDDDDDLIHALNVQGPRDLGGNLWQFPRTFIKLYKIFINFKIRLDQKRNN